MPHSTKSSYFVRPSSTGLSSTALKKDKDAQMEKFPDFEDVPASSNGNDSATRRSSSQHRMNGHANGGAQPDRWLPRQDGRKLSVRWGANTQPTGHSRQRSLSDAFHTIRTRTGSVSQNAQEIAGALKAPVSPRLILLCVMWYGSSALTNTSSKSILNAFDKPATLTLVQFAFVSSYCLLFASLASTFPRLRSAVPALKHGIRYPSRDVLRTTAPLAVFQIAGHLLSSEATSKIPVSLVHTIKGLSPLFTVLAYRIFFDIRYPTATWLSLIPLTVGVMLACSGKHSAIGGEIVGMVYALLAALMFVTQNIVSKRLFNEAAKAEAEGIGAQSKKLDKLNLLCYSSGLAFIATFPIWFWSEGIVILGDFLYDGSVDLNAGPETFDHGRLTMEFIFNGTFHFAQNILAFVLLSMVSPVTYSVASLIKRVFVVVVAILWFRNPTSNVQALGIGLTFFGLYLYDRFNESNKADRKARMMETKDQPLLPLNTGNTAPSTLGGPVYETPTVFSPTHAFSNGRSATPGDDKKYDGAVRPGASGSSNNNWLAPGTKQEDTWRRGDRVSAAS